MNKPTEADMALEVEQLQLALQAARVGTWDYNLVTGQAQWSAICKELFGLPADMAITADSLLKRVHPDDRERVARANASVLSPDSDGEHNIIFRTLIEGDNYRWVQAKGRTSVDGAGRTVRFNGIVIDVTELELAHEAQRQSTQVLEQHVTERTQALKEANLQLRKSNESLAEFAYIASHDLQEPLRKIQTFGDLLKNQYGTQLGEGVDYLNRMQTAAQRMSTLIKDLLTFSRINTQQVGTMKVSLPELIQGVLHDLEVTIQETGALVEVQPLPTVQGNPSQLVQLFQNLLSNAIKFRQKDIRPVIGIRADVVQADQLPPSVWPARTAPVYHCIDVVDNGIGFDEKYVDRIFQVFQRLHGKEQYAGTGIGLAICEKVANSHGGAITARSQPGHGTVFSLYLPH